MRHVRILAFLLALTLIAPIASAESKSVRKAPSPGCPVAIVASLGSIPVKQVQTHTQREYRLYAVKVFKRPTVSWRAIRKVVRMERCQHSTKARRNTEHLRKRLIRERRARQEQARQRAIAQSVAGWLYRTRMCESHGVYTTNTGNGFYGAYQFTLSTWASVGGSGNPANASPAEQDMRAAILYRQSGPGPWPVCGH